MNKEKWLKTAQEEGFESFEIYEELSEERRFSWFEGRMDTYQNSHVLGTAFRGIYDGRMVNASTEDTGDEQMDAVLAAMKEQAEMISADEKEEMRRPQETVPLERKEFVHFDASLIQDLLKETEEKILNEDERIFQVSHLIYEEESTARTITNSYGMNLREEGGAHVLIAGAAAKEGSEIRTSFEVKRADDIASFDTDGFARKISENVLSKLHAETPVSGEYPVIIEKEAMTSLFSAFSPMFSGEQIRKGISPLSDKTGEKIFSEKITVTDDPREKECAFACAFDDEGCPAKRKQIVKDGVFTTVLHSAKTALAMGSESTGNGFRSSYSSPIGVSPRGCSIQAGEKSFEELLAEMKDGILITDFEGLHAGLNHANGDFSLQASGILIKDGRKAGGLTLMTAAGNFLDLLSNVREVGSDLEWGIHSIAAPSILFSSVSISGK